MSQLPPKRRALSRFRLAVIATLSVLGVLALGLSTRDGFAVAQMMHQGGGMHGQGHGQGHGGMQGHDEMTMPGLRGLDATPQESEELAIMFRNFETMTRSVETLPDGIRTTTFSEDPEIMGVLVSHVMGMIDRVDEGRDPQVFIQSPTLDILFERRASITTMIDWTETGAIVVQQTSDDPEVVAALQTHAAEVTDMADRGMQAVHEAMTKRAAN